MLTNNNAMLIASGSYVEQELAGEFGKIPPAFLPLGNRRLAELQHERIATGYATTYLSLPRDYEISEADALWISNLEIRILRSDPNDDLRSALLAASVEIVMDQGQDASLGLLLGDTLFDAMARPSGDSITVASPVPEYRWTRALFDANDLVIGALDGGLDDQTSEILSGFFHFASLRSLVLSLNNSRDFASAISTYASERPLAPVRELEWHDLGHIHTYYRARMKLTTERSFNTLTAAGRTFQKESSRVSRMEAEANWFEKLPAELRIFSPQYLGRTAAGGYSIEYLYLSPLSDLFVFGELPLRVWRGMIAGAFEFLQAASAVGPPEEAAVGYEVVSSEYGYQTKGLQRLEEFSASGGSTDCNFTVNGIDTPSLRSIMSEIISALSSSHYQTLVHGDFCLSNILYDHRTKSIKAIDPRGQDMRETITPFGDPRYDLAKLSHSLNGMYDLIMAGRFEMQDLGDNRYEFSVLATARQFEIRDVFNGMVSDYISSAPPGSIAPGDVDLLTIYLFVSMLPLHEDSPTRQTALMLRALTLYTEWKRRA